MQLICTRSLGHHFTISTILNNQDGLDYTGVFDLGNDRYNDDTAHLAHCIARSSSQCLYSHSRDSACYSNASTRLMHRTVMSSS